MAHDDAEHPAPGSVPDAILAAIERQRETAAGEADSPERVPYLGFLLGEEVYGLPLQQLREVSRLTRLRRIPGAPPGVAGLVNLRGEIVCALDTRAILGLAGGDTGEQGYLLALRGFADPLGLLVDAIADIYAIDPAEIEPAPATWSAERAAYFKGTARVRDGLIGLLDLEQLVRI